MKSHLENLKDGDGFEIIHKYSIDELNSKLINRLSKEYGKTSRTFNDVIALIKLQKRSGDGSTFSINNERDDFGNVGLVDRKPESRLQGSIGKSGGDITEGLSQLTNQDETTKNVARARYEIEVEKLSTLFTESNRDRMVSLNILQKAIEEERGEKIEDWENAYWAENALSILIQKLLQEGNLRDEFHHYTK